MSEKRFDGIFSPETVRLCLAESAQSLIGARVDGYIPIFAIAEHHA